MPPIASSSPYFASHSGGQQPAAKFPLDLVGSTEGRPNEVDAQVHLLLLASVASACDQAVEDDPPLPHGFDQLELDSASVESLASVRVQHRRIGPI